jgi:hypothetical protein
MNIKDLNKYRKQKDDAMRGEHEPETEHERDEHTKDMLGQMHGVDANSHGVELQ